MRGCHVEAAGAAAADRGRAAARVFQVRHLGEQARPHRPSHQGRSEEEEPLVAGYILEYFIKQVLETKEVY